MVKQTDSSIASIRGFGCYFMSLLTLWQFAKDRKLTIAECEKVFSICVVDGSILDNKIKVGDIGWWRSFVSRPVGVFAAADSIGATKTIAEETYRNARFKETPDDQYTIIEYRTKFGSHFVVGRIEEGQAFIEYNPDPTIQLFEPKTIRHWKVA